MTAYIYLSSDIPLTTSDSSPNSQESFLFTADFDLKKQNSFSCSKHFSEAKFQVASPKGNLPKKANKQLKQENARVLHELFNYLVNHFENNQATYIEILFCSIGSENESIVQKKLITYEWLSVNDLYYDERKFIRIDKQTTEFIFGRIA